MIKTWELWLLFGFVVLYSWLIHKINGTKTQFKGNKTLSDVDVPQKHSGKFICMGCVNKGIARFHDKPGLCFDCIAELMGIKPFPHTGVLKH